MFLYTILSCSGRFQRALKQNRVQLRLLFLFINTRLTIDKDRLGTRFSLTILYCSSSILARSESLWNMDFFKPSVIATLSLTIGCNCLWSPIKTTCRAFEHVIGTRDCSSMHMPHSSTMHCWMLSQEVAILRIPATAHVHKIICTPDDWSAQFSAKPIS